jgi:hypothetical protein
MVLSISIESGVLCACVAGEFALAEAERTFLEVLDAVAQHKIGNVLFDGRKISGEPGTVERFYYGQFAADAVSAKRGMSPAPRFAYVLTEPVLDPHRFGETVARNRGMIVRAFSNPRDALQWLGLAVTNEPDIDNSQDFC